MKKKEREKRNDAVQQHRRNAGFRSERNRRQRIMAIVVELAEPDDFTIEKKEKKLYLMDSVIEDVTQYNLLVHDTDSDITYTLGCYGSEYEAERARRQTIRSRRLPGFHKLTLGEMAGQRQEAA